MVLRYLTRSLSRFSFRSGNRRFDKLEEKFKDDLVVRSSSGVTKLHLFALLSPACFAFDIRGFYWDLKEQFNRLNGDGSVQSEDEREYQRLLVLYWYLR